MHSARIKIMQINAVVQTGFFRYVKNGHYYTDIFGMNVLSLNRINLATEEDRENRLDYWAKVFKAETWEELRHHAEGSKAMGALERAETKLEETETKLEETEEKLEETETKLEEARAEAAQKDREIAELRKQLAEAQN